MVTAFMVMLAPSGSAQEPTQVAFEADTPGLAKAVAEVLGLPLILEDEGYLLAVPPERLGSVRTFFEALPYTRVSGSKEKEYLTDIVPIRVRLRKDLSAKDYTLLQTVYRADFRPLPSPLLRGDWMLVVPPQGVRVGSYAEALEASPLITSVAYPRERETGFRSQPERSH